MGRTHQKKQRLNNFKCVRWKQFVPKHNAWYLGTVTLNIVNIALDVFWGQTQQYRADSFNTWKQFALNNITNLLTYKLIKV